MSFVDRAIGAARNILDPRYRRYYTQRFITDPKRRFETAERIARKAPRSAPNAPLAQIEQLKEDGLIFLPNLVRPDQVADMRRYYETQTCSDIYRPHLGRFIAPGSAPKETHVGLFDNDQVVNAPHAVAIANHPLVLSLAAAYLGAKPTIDFMSAWWSIPTGGKGEHAELFHRDVYDYRILKFFIYLTDVDEQSGPHIYIKRTQNAPRLTEVRRLSDEEVAKEFPGQQVLIDGKAGTAFLEDTYGIHRGLPPATKPRLLYQVMYTLRPGTLGPKAPIARVPAVIDGVTIDPYINRVYCTVV